MLTGGRERRERAPRAGGGSRSGSVMRFEEPLFLDRSTSMEYVNGSGARVVVDSSYNSRGAPIDARGHAAIVDL